MRWFSLQSRAADIRMLNCDSYVKTRNMQTCFFPYMWNIRLTLGLSYCIMILIHYAVMNQE